VASALTSAIPYAADALVILGVFVITVGVYGAIRMPDTYTRLHAMSKAVFLGVVSLCASSAVTGDPAIIYRAVLIGAFLLVTTPISSFVIARRILAWGEDGDARRVRRVRARAHKRNGVSGPKASAFRRVPRPVGIAFTAPRFSCPEPPSSGCPPTTSTVLLAQRLLGDAADENACSRPDMPSAPRNLGRRPPPRLRRGSSAGATRFTNRSRFRLSGGGFHLL
jgi:multicomponent Na+:H+ antiporter subunit G